MRQRQILVNHLPHLEGWLHIECDLGDYAQSAQSNPRAGKPVPIFLPGQGHDLTVRRDDFQSGHSRRQVAVLAARAMRGSGACARHRDMRQRGQVVHRKALAIDVRSQSAVSDAAAHGDSTRLRVQRHLVEKLHRNLVVLAVGDPVERMARARAPSPCCSSSPPAALLRRIWEGATGRYCTGSCPPNSSAALVVAAGRVTTRDSTLPATRAPEVLRNCLLFILSNSDRNNI